MSFFKTMFAAFFGVLLALVVLFLFGLVFLLGLVNQAKEQETVQVEANTVLKLDLGRPLQERAEPDPFGSLFGNTQPLGLNQVLAAIKAAKTDDRIKGIYLSSGWFGGGQASAESIRNALLDFRQSGKFIYAYNEYYSETAYYLATTADSIFIYPEGYMEWNGLASTPMFYRGALDKLGVQPLVFKVGTFKSYTEAYTETKMSDANRLQTTELLNDIWQHMLQGVSKRRNLPVDQLQALATNLSISNGGHAMSNKLVDGLYTESQVFRLMKLRVEGAPAKDWNPAADSTWSEDDTKITFINADDYAETTRKTDGGGNRVAIIYAEGEIGMGAGSNTSIGINRTAGAIRKARMDDRVKAIVLRINSPGGSALVSDILWREVIAAKAQKPVIASFGDVAASGGYFMAAGADAIVAEPNTITGSIGILAILFNTQELLTDKLGLTFDRVTTNPSADLANPNRPMTPAEAAFLQRNTNDGYGDFIKAVQTGRRFPDSLSVDRIAQGRVYSGIRARQLNLVDTLGGIDVALAMAAGKAGLGDDYAVATYPEYRSAWEELRDGFSLRTWVASQFLTREQQELRSVLTRFNDPRHLYARMPQDIKID